MLNCIHIKLYTLIDWLFLLNATFSNISAISWRPIVVVEKDRVPKREPLTMDKQLVNFITYGSESSSSVFVI